MNLYFLKYFYDAVRLGSVTEAALTNNITQSAVSQAIKQLEISLGTCLLTHKRNSIKVTEDGASVYEWSRSIFRQVDDLKSRLKGNQQGYYGSLTFACSHSIGLSILPEILAEYRKTAPQVTLKTLFGHTGLMRDWIKQGVIEFGILLDNDDISDFNLIKMHTGHFRLFQSKTQPKKKKITHAIFPPARGEVYEFKRSFHRKYKYEIGTEMEISSWEAIARLITLSDSAGFIPDYITWGLDKVSEIQACSIDLSIPYNIYIGSLKGEDLSKNAKLFADILKAKFVEV